MSSDPSPKRAELLTELGTQVRASQRSTDAVDELVTELMGINRTDARCLDLIDEHNQLSAGQLAELSGLSTGAITAVIDRLERAGIAQRVADPNDRRKVLVELTQHGRELSWELMGKPMMERAYPVMSSYTDEQLELLIDFNRRARELQDEHAAWLRERLEEPRKG